MQTDQGNILRRSAFFGLFLVTALPWITAPAALTAGVAFSLAFGNPFPELTAKTSKSLLKLSVAGLGFGINFVEVITLGRSSLLLTLVTITATVALGELLGRALKVPKNTRQLVSFGSAICGGSAIAALAPVIKAGDEEIAVSLATIFSLNAAALLLFPPVGHLLALGERQFGLWAALAIHDTSSVVGATAAYGAIALGVGTTVKLTRALWIAPCTLAVGVLRKSAAKATIPLFIIGFLAAAAINTSLPAFGPLWSGLHSLARQALVMTLFLVGAGLTRQVLRRVGMRPLLLGVTLWIVISAASLALILGGYIR